MEKKITKKEMFAQIKAALTDEAQIAFIDHEIELLSKKSGSKKPTANQIANEAIKEDILAVVTADGMTATEVLASSEKFAGFSNQKIATLLNQLVKDGKLDKVTEGKKSIFKAI
jgi:hypothetical protein